MREMQNTNRIVVGKPERMTQVRRVMLKWILGKLGLRMLDWIHVALDRDE